MFRTIRFTFFPFVFFGCAPGGMDSDTWIGVQADAKDLAGGSTPRLLLPVRYAGAAEGVVIQVLRPLEDGRDQVVAWGEVSDGIALVALPARVAGDGPSGISFRVAARQLADDGSPGAWLDLADESLMFQSPGKDAAGTWFVEVPNPDDKPDLAPLRRGVDVADRLVPEPQAAVRGGISDDVAGRFGLSLLTDAEAFAPAWTPPLATTIDGTFTVGARGAPPADSLRGADGPTSGRFWTVAWTDADGEAGFDPAADAIVGLACTAAGVYTLVWQAPPVSTASAQVVLDSGLPAGWSARVEGTDGLQAPSPAIRPWLSGDCL